MCRHLAVQIYPSDVLPLGLLNSDPVRGHLISPDAAVGGPHHFYGDPTPDISSCTSIYELIIH